MTTLKFRILTAAFILLGFFGLSSAASASFLDERGSFKQGGGFAQRYVPPITGLLNESPFITTEIRPLYAYHVIPSSAPVQGGYVHAVAAQARLALTDRLGFIATKDGYSDLHFSQAFADTDGFNNIAAGLKYALIAKPERDYIMSAGVRYEATSGNIPTGGIDLAGADGSGLVDVFVTSAKTYDALGIQASIGANIALDDNKNSTELHYSLHFDYELWHNFFPVLEFNGLTTLNEGKVIDLNLEGGDLFNIGTRHSGTVITLGLGCRYVFNDHFRIGAAWEPSLTSREDLHESRTYVDAVISF